MAANKSSLQITSDTIMEVVLYILRFSELEHMIGC